ncbi:hypothetical protein V7152_09730 [Neobacillus drentensis]|uniref:hypothetical protein n=1 Tax=Neobacillus drentensis TaxID=220684 RepID=UPI002FFD9D8C
MKAININNSFDVKKEIIAVKAGKTSINKVIKVVSLLVSFEYGLKKFNINHKAIDIIAAANPKMDDFFSIYVTLPP